MEAHITGANGATVLVVEDNPGIREFIEAALQDEGFQIEAVPDGAAAIQAIDHQRPPSDHLCLILLDMMLPKADGLEVLRHLSEHGAHVPVVAMSADRSKLRAAGEAGVQETLPKPFDIDKLLEVVGRCCLH